MEPTEQPHDGRSNQHLGSWRQQHLGVGWQLTILKWNG